MSDSASELRTRRALLTGGIAGLAALIAGAVLRPLPAEAADGDPVILGDQNVSSPGLTSIESSSSNWSLKVQNDSTTTTGLALGLLAISNNGIAALVQGPNGLQANAPEDGGVAVHGLKYVNTGPAVKGENRHSANGYAAVYGLTNGSGPGVYGEGTAQGNGTSGVARGTGSGVYGQSDNGRGGRFNGKKAQLKLDPSAAATHPATGDAGDIFLDKSKRLWLCKGGTTWVRLDL